MSLKEYHSKRNFAQTSEPKGKVEKSEKMRFVVQYHEARAKHFDFRLEFDGVLLSWAVPKGFSYDTKIKRLAVKVEDHPLDYINFEGVIKKGNYGAGTVQIFDKGEYEPLFDMRKGLKKGHIKIQLFGEKLHGGWSLLRTKDNSWLLTKLQDEYANLNEPTVQKAKNPFKDCSVQLATLTTRIPGGQNWIFEIKYDGYRMLAYGENGKVKIVSRNKVDYTKKFPNIATKLSVWAEKYTFVLDGEMVAFDENGRSDFGLLQDAMKTKRKEICYAIFDILAFQGEDLREKTLKERKKILNNLISGDEKVLLLSSFVEGKGKECFELAKKLNLEGIVAKDLNSTYNGLRDETWLKIKCRHRQEFVVIGYTKTPQNSILSAILVCFYQNLAKKCEKTTKESNKSFKNQQKTDLGLVYVGKVGSGFDDLKRKELAAEFDKFKSVQPPLLNLPKMKDDVVWLKPNFVAEIEFAEFTKDNLLRQPVFLGIRTDKSPQDVVLEVENEK